ncbi:hypothetical protein EV127DRAFT_500535 [Xylaria flabelliformis]|nr:hypothetical protein EV127DRAFT_500535 [Xylaria flabelliformis]
MKATIAHFLFGLCAAVPLHERQEESEDPNATFITTGSAQHLRIRQVSTTGYGTGETQQPPYPTYTGQPGYGGNPGFTTTGGYYTTAPQGPQPTAPAGGGQEPYQPTQYPSQPGLPSYPSGQYPNPSGQYPYPTGQYPSQSSQYPYPSGPYPTVSPNEPQNQVQDRPPPRPSPTGSLEGAVTLGNVTINFPRRNIRLPPHSGPPPPRPPPCLDGGKDRGPPLPRPTPALDPDGSSPPPPRPPHAVA